MADAAHNYSRGDRAALILFSAGTCYFPGCRERLIKEVDGSYEIALEIAHIRAAKARGERYVADMDDIARAAFDNIIFLCIAHHKTVDKPGAAEKYPIELLQEWKDLRERGAPDQLRGLREVTEDKLVEMISTAVREREADYHQTLRRLEDSDQEAAALLRELRAELEGLRGSRSLVDPDLVDTLNHAANKLVGFRDYASQLNRTAHQLSGLPDTATQLNHAGTRLANVQQYVGELHRVADRLMEAAASVEDAARRFRR